MRERAERAERSFFFAPAEGGGFYGNLCRIKIENIPRRGLYFRFLYVFNINRRLPYPPQPLRRPIRMVRVVRFILKTRFPTKTQKHVSCFSEFIRLTLWRALIMCSLMVNVINVF